VSIRVSTCDCCSGNARSSIGVTSGVRKAERFPVSRKRKPGQPAHRPVRSPKLTVNEREYADAVELAWNRIPTSVIQEQWVKPQGGNSLGGVVDAFVPYEGFLAELTMWQVDQSGVLMFNEIKRDVAAQWKTFEKATPSQTALAMKFNRASPMATAYASLSAGNMVRDMIDSQVRSVRSVVTRAFNDGLTRQQTSRNLIQVLNEIPTPRGAIVGNYAVGHMFGNATKGLTVRYADAVVNRAARLVRQNPDISAVDLKRKADQYGAKLRRSRARTIARTELMRASNQGRLQGMWQAADQGLVDPTLAKKQWVTSSFDVCPICVPLNGVTVGIRDSFGPPGQAPPAHPNCRCTVRMLPDPMTFGLPTTTGTGQTGSPMQLIRPTRPGLKIQDLDEAAGVVAPAAPLVDEPATSGLFDPEEAVDLPSLSTAETIQPTTSRTGNASADFDVPTAKKAQETVGVVLQQMDDAGYVINQQLPAGTVQVKLMKQKPSAMGEGGSFAAETRKTRPKRPPQINATDEQIDNYKRRMQEWNDKGGKEAVLTVRTGPDVSVGSMQNVATHEIGHRFDKIVRQREIELRRRASDGGSFETYTEMRTIVEGNYSEKTVQAVVEKIGRSQAAAAGRNIRTASISNVIDADDVFQKLTIADLDSEFASEAMLQFFQAVGRSNALAELRNLASQLKGAGNWGKYASSPTELFARAFNQYFTMRHGSAEAIEDMLQQISKPLWSEVTDRSATTQDVWYGFQWRKDEFEELIEPHVENVLKHLGVME
jgi:hypothetical protein